MYQTRLLILFFSLSISLLGQHVVNNMGILQPYNKGLVGFHTGFINDVNFDDNLGLIGCNHREKRLLISEGCSLTFYDFETAVVGDLYLEISIYVHSSLNYIIGNTISEKYSKRVYAQISKNVFYLSAVDNAKIYNLTVIKGQKFFSNH